MGTQWGRQRQQEWEQATTILTRKPTSTDTHSLCSTSDTRLGENFPRHELHNERLQKLTHVNFGVTFYVNLISDRTLRCKAQVSYYWSASFLVRHFSLHRKEKQSMFSSHLIFSSLKTKFVTAASTNVMNYEKHKSSKGLTLVQALRSRVGAKGCWRHFF